MCHLCRQSILCSHHLIVHLTVSHLHTQFNGEYLYSSSCKRTIFTYLHRTWHHDVRTLCGAAGSRQMIEFSHTSGWHIFAGCSCIGDSWLSCHWTLWCGHCGPFGTHQIASYTMVSRKKEGCQVCQHYSVHIAVSLAQGNSFVLVAV